MADAVLLTRLQFRRGEAALREEENRVVAEPVRATGRVCDPTFEDTLLDPKPTVGSEERDGAAEAGGARLVRHPLQLSQQLRHAVGIAPTRPRVTRAVNARRAAQRIHLQAGVVGKDPGAADGWGDGATGGRGDEVRGRRSDFDRWVAPSPRRPLTPSRR